MHGLVSLAARALGIADTATIADYFRLTAAQTRPAVEALLQEGELREVTVMRPEGPMPMLLHAAAPRPSPVRVCALVSPFDPLVFHRPRLKALFDVDYRIGIYTPREKRTTGYYSLLFLMGDLIPARVDLRADRAGGVLEVRGAYPEPLPQIPQRLRPSSRAVAEALLPELHRTARWQGLSHIDVFTAEGTGELSSVLNDVTMEHGPVLGA